MSLGSNIRARREALKLSQSDIARMTNVTPALICQIERGSKTPNLLLGKQFADIFGCKVDDLLLDYPSTLRELYPLEKKE